MWWSWLLVGCGGCAAATSSCRRAVASSRSRIATCTLTMSAMAVLTILCAGEPGRGRALGESAALYALNAPRRGDERCSCDGGAEEAMTASIACAIAASSASELENDAWP
jgi:hypothetical protein